MVERSPSPNSPSGDLSRSPRLDDGTLWRVRNTNRNAMGSPMAAASVRQHVGIRAKKSLAIEMNHVVRVFRDPYFGFPSDVR